MEQEMKKALGDSFKTSTHEVSIDWENRKLTLKDRISEEILVVENHEGVMFGNHFEILLRTLEHVKFKCDCNWYQAFLLSIYDNNYFIFSK